MSKCKFDFESTNLSNRCEVRKHRGQMGELFYITRSLINAEFWLSQLFERMKHLRDLKLGTTDPKAPNNALLISRVIEETIGNKACLVVNDDLNGGHQDPKFIVKVSYDPDRRTPYALHFNAPDYLFTKPMESKPCVTHREITYYFNDLPMLRELETVLSDYAKQFPYTADEAHDEFVKLVKAQKETPTFNWLGKPGRYVSNITGTRHYNLTYFTTRKWIRTDKHHVECLLRTMMGPTKIITI
ncbi:hypothetical protein [Vibrio phage phiKT1028]|nr:hypothetical protein [Vibrio phage phiKT1028]